MTTGAKQRFEEALRAWEARFLTDGLAQPVLEARSKLVDEAVAPQFAGTLGTDFQGEAALLAVGGYGRRELFPHSDVDLLVLVRRALPTPAFKSAMSEFLRRLWDSGLRVSHSVRTPEECAVLQAGNLELSISLLDGRFLAGDSELHAEMQSRFGKFLNSARRELARGLCKAARARHARFHNTIFRLEPEIKEGPGGLRDWHTVRWLGQCQGDGPEPHEGAAQAQFAAMTRCFLHFRNGRDHNLLDFESQDALAESGPGGARDTAEWMGAWYRNASEVYRAARAALEEAETRERSLLVSFRDWKSRLSNADFTVSRNLVLLKNPAELKSGPALALRLFLFVGRHGMAPSRETERRIEAQVEEWKRGRQGVQPGLAFWKELLSLGQPSAAIRAMRATGFLAAILPEWERLDHLVVRDFHHQYTVDEHTTVALENLEELSAARDETGKALAAILEECEGTQWMLRLAVLFHDTGKGLGARHAEESVRLARGFLARVGAAELDADTILFLLADHLTLSTALQTRDVADPAVVSSLAERIRTIERLKLLTLITYADVSAVHPGAMTPWRASQLLSLYRSLYRKLEGDLGEAGQAEARHALGELGEGAAEFLEGLPARYFWTHTREEAESEAELYHQAAASGAEVKLVRGTGVWRATVVAWDHPFLFASLAGALSAFGLEILQAEAFTNQRGFAVDSFLCFDPHRSLDLNPPEQERLRATIRKAARGAVDVESLLRRRPQRAAPARSAALAPAVAVSQEISPRATVVEVVAQDRPGLLYSLAATISRHGCNIEVVLVDTRAHKAIDVFYVTREGGRLPEEAAGALQRDLTAACAPPAGQARR